MSLRKWKTLNVREKKSTINEKGIQILEQAL